ncbi:MAG: hypothetical protein R2911_01020 [Caldilineaceae bacterium]
MPLCDTRLVTVRNGRSATPNFHFKTFSGFDAAGNVLPAGAGVPLPGRIFGIVVDDLNLSTNPQELFYGEKYGIPNLPIGIYDFSNRLVKTIQTDPQGQYEVILPSTSSYNCPLPAGPAQASIASWLTTPVSPVISTLATTRLTAPSAPSLKSGRASACPPTWPRRR